jgi:hypothetical protein
MATPYIPARDADFQNWANNFSTRITATPGTFGLISADAVAIAAAYATWNAAYLLAINPSTRTPVTVADKDTARINAQAIMRPYAQAISQNAGVTVDDKIDVGVNPRTNGPTPVAAPTSAPVLSLIAGTYLQHLLRYRDEGAPATSRAKPPNVLQIQIYAAASSVVVTDPAVLPLKAVATKVPVTIAWDSADRGKPAYYSSRWITRTGLVGPWSDLQSIIVV